MKDSDPYDHLERATTSEGLPVAPSMGAVVEGSRMPVERALIDRRTVIVCAMAIAEGKIPPTINLEDQDPECKLDFVALTGRERRVKHALNNSFGFGGTNASLLFSRYEG